MKRLVGYIIFMVFTRHVVRTRIHTEYRKITGMPRLYPIIRISAKLPNGIRRCPDQAYVQIGFLHNHVIFIAVVECLDVGFIMVSSLCIFDEGERILTQTLL